MLDTHIAVALYEGRTAGLGAHVKRRLDRGQASISPAVALELELLHEIGRLRPDATAIASYLAEQLGIRIAADRFADVAMRALGLAFTRDPFDRLIVAHADLGEAALVTFDERMLRHYPRATR